METFFQQSEHNGKRKKITKPYLDSEEFYIYLVNRIFSFSRSSELVDFTAYLEFFVNLKKDHTLVLFYSSAS